MSTSLSTSSTSSRDSRRGIKRLSTSSDRALDLNPLWCLFRIFLDKNSHFSLFPLRPISMIKLSQFYTNFPSIWPNSALVPRSHTKTVRLTGSILLPFISQPTAIFALHHSIHVFPRRLLIANSSPLSWVVIIFICRIWQCRPFYPLNFIFP